MSRDEVKAGLQGIFREVFDRDSIDLTDQTTAADVPEWDSLHHINIIVAAEQRFGVRFLMSEVARLNNVGQFVDLIAAKLG